MGRGKWLVKSNDDRKMSDKQKKDCKQRREENRVAWSKEERSFWNTILFDTVFKVSGAEGVRWKW